ncbi:MAG: N5-carboxyaminoimidazole ribonucleotide synthase [Gaiellaceae bacterium]|nr:MAG: N5-carboxyaminoimidazole ribonucleotide synthase [Gaiellaceae bacterium]
MSGRATVVGCIGGGQLGRMLALAGAPLGIRMRFLDPAADACAGHVGELLVGPYDDPALLDRLAAGADAVTYEFENVPPEAARRVGALPDVRALERGQDRLVEKELFRALGIPTARFGSLEDVGVPALVKSRRLGYDGKGQRLVEAVGSIGEDELAEELVPFDRELSVIAVRSRDGETAFYPVTENEHRGGILAVSRAPAPDAPQREAEEIATRLLDELGYVGVVTVELFEVEGRLLANEFAPRVHNSGHWTIDGAVTSQFESHLRAILGLPLGETRPLGSATMVNLVGSLPPLERLLAVPGAHVHLYGKEPRPGRKLGHVTLVDADEQAVAEVVALAERAWVV